jgi:hypothetical protein
VSLLERFLEVQVKEGWNGTNNVILSFRYALCAKFRHYHAVLTRKSDGSPDKMARSKRFFCEKCSAMLWLHDDKWKQVYIASLRFSIQIRVTNKQHQSPVNHYDL